MAGFWADGFWADGFWAAGFWVEDDAPLAITTSSLPGGYVGVSYSATVVATGGTAPRTFAITDGALPDGLSLNESTGAITGTPTTEGTFAFTITVTDDNEDTGDQAFDVNIDTVSARTELAVQRISREGLAPAFVSANAFGHALPNAGREFVVVRTSDTGCTVTFQTPGHVDELPIDDRVETVAPNSEQFFGPFPTSIYSQADGAVYIDIDDVTGVTIGAFRVS